MLINACWLACGEVAVFSFFFVSVFRGDQVPKKVVVLIFSFFLAGVDDSQECFGVMLRKCDESLHVRGTSSLSFFLLNLLIVSFEANKQQQLLT